MSRFGISEAACAYPITPSTTMAAQFQAAVADGRTNLWGTPLAFIEPESEHSSASAAEGFALAGGRTTNFTAGQGLILMKEVLYVIAGKRLPVVFHVGARALTSQGLNIHAGHDDVMGVADTGWGILFARSPQEAADLTAIARRTAESCETPFIVAQDGFLTTHTLGERPAARGRAAPTVRGGPAPAHPDLLRPGFSTDDWRRAEPGLVHEGADRAARVLRGPGRCAGGGDDRMGGAYRAALWPDRCIPHRGRRARRGQHGNDRGHDRGCGRSLAPAGASGRRGRRHCIPTIPRRSPGGRIGSATAVAVIERTDEPAAHDNPLTREVKAALGRSGSRRRTDPARRFRIGRPRIARRNGR